MKHISFGELVLLAVSTLKAERRADMLFGNVSACVSTRAAKFGNDPVAQTAAGGCFYTETADFRDASRLCCSLAAQLAAQFAVCVRGCAAHWIKSLSSISVFTTLRPQNCQHVSMSHLPVAHQ